MILTNIPEGAEVLDVIAHDAETARKAGVSEANSRVKRGYVYRCIGVVESVKRIDAESYTVDAEGFSHTQPDSRTIRGYQPVLYAHEALPI